MLQQTWACVVVAEAGSDFGMAPPRSLGIPWEGHTQKTFPAVVVAHTKKGVAVVGNRGNGMEEDAVVNRPFLRDHMAVSPWEGDHQRRHAYFLRELQEECQEAFQVEWRSTVACYPVGAERAGALDTDSNPIFYLVQPVW